LPKWKKTSCAVFNFYWSADENVAEAIGRAVSSCRLVTWFEFGTNCGMDPGWGANRCTNAVCVTAYRISHLRRLSVGQSRLPAGCDTNAIDYGRDTGCHSSGDSSVCNPSPDLHDRGGNTNTCSDDQPEGNRTADDPRGQQDRTLGQQSGNEIRAGADTEVLFSIWDTRVEDFRAFVKESRYDATGEMWALSKDGWTQWGATWESPGFKQGSDHPVVGVSWNDAKAFCAWLTKKEQAAGRLPSEMVYRLPTDEEWSVAVGLSQESGDTPEDKSAKVLGYPWGKQWPPPKGAGNYAGEEARSDWGVIRGYNDGWPCTSPVGSFQANKFGLYDMGGNVAQWCEDWSDSRQTFRVLRGGSWSSGKAEYLLSSDRASNTPENRSANHGFRCVIAAGSAR
jgi:hypothetical protein